MGALGATIISETLAKVYSKWPPEVTLFKKLAHSSQNVLEVYLLEKCCFRQLDHQLRAYTILWWSFVYPARLGGVFGFLCFPPQPLPPADHASPAIVGLPL